MVPTPSKTSKQLSPCVKGTMQKIASILEGIVKKLGEAGFNIFKSTFNTFMEQIKAILQPFLTLVHTLLTIDKFVYDTFVKPPLTAVVDELAAIQDTIKKPLSMLQMSSECKDTSRFRDGVNKVVGFLTKDVNGLRNWLERLDYNFQWQTDLIASLEQGIALLTDLSIKAGYQDWIDHNYNFLYLFAGPSGG